MPKMTEQEIRNTKIHSVLEEIRRYAEIIIKDTNAALDLCTLDAKTHNYIEVECGIDQLKRLKIRMNDLIGDLWK